MFIVDSCGWLEWFSNGPLADRYQEYLEQGDKLMVPAIILYEVYKVLKRQVGEETALLAAGYMKNHEIVPFDALLSLQAADASLNHKLAMADAIVYGVAMAHGCEIITSDADLKNLPGVTFIPKKMR